MKYTPENAAIVLRLVEDCLKQDLPPDLRLQNMWVTLLRTRIHALANGARVIIGDKVHGGPFKGMTLPGGSLVAAETSVMLGCYEHELHATVEKIIAGNYTRILNIGCSVGYYAVGFARRMNNAAIEAFDTAPEARQKCAEMAQINGVADKVRISGEFRGEDFSKYASEKVLVFVDIEGGEMDLLDPVRYPALGKMDVVVELHDVIDPKISKSICERFAPTHTVELIQNRTMLPAIDDLLPPGATLDPFDHLMLGWDGRSGATPWGVFIAKS